MKSQQGQAGRKTVPLSLSVWWQDHDPHSRCLGNPDLTDCPCAAATQRALERRARRQPSSRPGPGRTGLRGGGCAHPTGSRQSGPAAPAQLRERFCRPCAGWASILSLHHPDAPACRGAPLAHRDLVWAQRAQNAGPHQWQVLSQPHRLKAKGEGGAGACLRRAVAPDVEALHGNWGKEVGWLTVWGL